MPTSVEAKGLGLYRCSFCDSDQLPSASCRKVAEDSNIQEIFCTLDSLVKLSEYRATPQTRIWGMMSLRRILNHTENSSYLNAQTTELGQWCLATLATSIRELRIAARWVKYTLKTDNY